MTDDIDKTFIWYKESDKNPYTIMQRLCTNLMDEKLGTVTFWTTETEQSTYKAKESLFVTIICNSLLAKDDNKNAKQNNKDLPLNTILKHHNIWSLWIACLNNSNNTTNLSNPNCENRTKASHATDYPFIFYNVSSIIYNDIINLMMARIYWAIDVNEEVNNLANAYTINYFNTIGYLPEAKSYPQMYKKLTEYIKLWKNMQQSLRLIDIKKIDEQTATNLNQWSVFLQYNPYNTAWAQSKIDTLPTYQWVSIDIMYNELFFYTLFIKIYDSYLERWWQNKENIPKSLQSQDNIATIILHQRAKIAQQQQNLQKAVEQSIRQVNNTISTFPIHIGLLMYQEDLLKMRNNLAKIYLPIHQLHYKLENVQSKD